MICATICRQSPLSPITRTCDAPFLSVFISAGAKRESSRRTHSRLGLSRWYRTRAIDRRRWCIFAALAYVGESNLNPILYYQNNVGGTASLLGRDARLWRQQDRVFIELRSLRRRSFPFPRKHPTDQLVLMAPPK